MSLYEFKFGKKISTVLGQVDRGGNRDYFMVGECVRFLSTSCEGSLDGRVSTETSEFSDRSQRANNKNRTNELTMN